MRKCLWNVLNVPLPAKKVYYHGFSNRVKQVSHPYWKQLPVDDIEII